MLDDDVDFPLMFADLDVEQLIAYRIRVDVNRPLEQPGGFNVTLSLRH